jgi:MurNAc alpha-1-phosphate uridylyltransferase
VTTSLCAVVLAAGEGRRLRPLTGRRPKALCPVGNVALLDLALNRVRAVGMAGPATVAVNASYLAEQVVAHVGARAHMSVEPDMPLGTSGALGKLRDWIAGRGVLIANADAYLAKATTAEIAKAATAEIAGATTAELAKATTAGLSTATKSSSGDIAALLDGWDGKTVRLLGVPARAGQQREFGDFRFAGFSLLPWDYVRTLPAEPTDLVRTVWRPAEAAGALNVVPYGGTYFDTGTPADYLKANLHAAGGGSLIAPDAIVTGRYERAVVGAGAVIHGELTRAVVWPGVYVGADEHLIDTIRIGADVTVPAG